MNEHLLFLLLKQLLTSTNKES